MIYKIQQAFEEQYGMAPELKVKAPGRINIIGDHTDYNLGFVLPAAIDKYTYFACARSHSQNISVTSYDYGKTLEITPDIDAITSVGWQKYIEAITLILKEKGYPFQGFHLLMGGDIPIGAGLSSSAALTCGIILCISELFQLKISKSNIALLAQQAEIRIGLNCGLMDQYAVIQSKKNHCLFLDCKNLTFDFLPADFHNCTLVLINSNIKHHLAESEYNHRRLDVENALNLLQRNHPEITSLRQVSLTLLRATENDLDELSLRRLSFVLEENERVLGTCEALKAGNPIEVGRLMNESHKGLSCKYEVSCPELDFLADFAQQKDYVLGSRMMGGGFGGCTINLVKKGFEEQLISEASSAYKLAMGKEPTGFIVGIGEGLCVI